MGVEAELDDICGKILALLDKNLIPKSTSGESKVFYQKMKADYYRYIAEYTEGDKKKAQQTQPRRHIKRHRQWPKKIWLSLTPSAWALPLTSPSFSTRCSASQKRLARWLARRSNRPSRSLTTLLKILTRTPLSSCNCSVTT